MIAHRPIVSSPKRLQPLLMRLIQYDEEIKYRCGPEIYLADTLSRAHLQQMPPPGKADHELEWIHSVDFVPASEPQTQENQQQPANNPLLQSLKAVILDGQMKEKVYLCPYVNMRHALTAQDGVILGSQVCYTNKAKTQDYREDSPLSHWHLRLSKNSPKSCLLAEHQSINQSIYLSINQTLLKEGDT